MKQRLVQNLWRLAVSGVGHPRLFHSLPAVRVSTRQYHSVAVFSFSTHIDLDRLLVVAIPVQRTRTPSMSCRPLWNLVTGCATSVDAVVPSSCTVVFYEVKTSANLFTDITVAIHRVEDVFPSTFLHPLNSNSLLVNRL